MNLNLNMFQLQRLHLNAKIFSFTIPNHNIPLFPRNLSHSSSSVKIRSSRHLVTNLCRRSFRVLLIRYYALELGFLMFAVGVYSREKDLLEAFKRPMAISDLSKTQAPRPIKNVVILDNEKVVVGLVGAALALTMVRVGPASAAELPLLASSLQLSNHPMPCPCPPGPCMSPVLLNGFTAMALVWQYGEKSEYEAWKGLSWGMVPLLGGAFCACTWHFFYNFESLQALVAVQAAPTVIGYNHVLECISFLYIRHIHNEGKKEMGCWKVLD